MDNIQKTKSSEEDQECVTPVSRTRTMIEIMETNKDNIISQSDTESGPCLRRRSQHPLELSEDDDVVVTMIKRTRTMNDIIESNPVVMDQRESDGSGHFLRSQEIKSGNNSEEPDVRPVKRTRTMNDVISSNNPDVSQLTDSHNLRSSVTFSETSVLELEPLSRTKTMKEIMASNNLDLYQYLNESEHYLRSTKKTSSNSSSNNTPAKDDNSFEPLMKRTRTMNEIIESNKGELPSDMDSHYLRKRNSESSQIAVSAAEKASELERLNEEYVDMQIKFTQVRRQELQSVLGVLTKSRLAHKRLMQETADNLTDIMALGEGSSPAAKKLELFFWVNKTSVKRCQDLIKEVIEMDEELHDRVNKIENLLPFQWFLPASDTSPAQLALAPADTQKPVEGQTD